MLLSDYSMHSAENDFNRMENKHYAFYMIFNKLEIVSEQLQSIKFSFFFIVIAIYCSNMSTVAITIHILYVNK